MQIVVFLVSGSKDHLTKLLAHLPVEKVCAIKSVFLLICFTLLLSGIIMTLFSLLHFPVEKFGIVCVVILLLSGSEEL